MLCGKETFWMVADNDVTEQEDLIRQSTTAFWRKEQHVTGYEARLFHDCKGLGSKPKP